MRLKIHKIAKNNRKALGTNKKALVNESFLSPTLRHKDVSFVEFDEKIIQHLTLSVNANAWWTRRESNPQSRGAELRFSTKSGPASSVNVTEINIRGNMVVSSEE